MQIGIENAYYVIAVVGEGWGGGAKQLLRSHKVGTLEETRL